MTRKKRAEKKTTRASWYSVVREKIIPSREELVAEQKMVKRLLREIKSSKGPHVGAILAGSLARNTHLRGDRDIDVFVFYPPTLSREKFEQAGLKLGHTIFGKHFHEEAYSEHPYVRGTIDGFDVEIVPTFKVKKASEKLSAVDRTPFHAEYMRRRLSKKQCDEVRFLKQFFKTIQVYGADVKAQGIPGYLVEILILKYGDFSRTVKAISEWRDHIVIDIEKSYASEKEASVHFQRPFLLVVDPTDASRNVAGALSYNQFARMILACRVFLSKPSIDFFIRPKNHVLSRQQMKSYLRSEELVGVRFPYPAGLLPDVVWGQLQRVSKKLVHGMQSHSFIINRSFFWTDESKHILVLLNVENPILQKSMKRVGPKIVDASHVRAFLDAHPEPLSGPRVEDGRIILETPREFTQGRDALLHEAKKAAGSESGEFGDALKHMSPVSEVQLLQMVSHSPDLASALSVFLKGKEFFL